MYIYIYICIYIRIYIYTSYIHIYIHTHTQDINYMNIHVTYINMYTHGRKPKGGTVKKRQLTEDQCMVEISRAVDVGAQVRENWKEGDA